MPKFKKGDICKVNKERPDGASIPLGSIVVVSHFIGDDSYSVDYPAEESPDWAIRESYLEPLQGSELEEFLKEYPQYRNEPDVPEMMQSRYERAKVESDQIAQYTSEKLSGLKEADPADIMNVKAGNYITDGKNESFVIDELPNSVFIVKKPLLGEYGITEWCPKERLSENGWIIVTDKPKQKTVTVTIDGKTSKYDAQALSRALEGLEELE